jgi:acetylornithine deacetylase/succinyl-diaminopimelate desuccinylase family protein
MEHQAALTRALEAHKDDIFELAGDLMRIPSENPPGECYRQCVDRIRSELDRLGFACRVVEAPGCTERPRYNLLAFHGEGQRTLYFHGHYDVVPAQSREQFVPRVENGQLTGRGSADMKAAVAGMIHAAAIVKESGIPLRGRIGLCIVPDEETGGQGGSRYLDEIGLLGSDGFAMLTPEPTGGVVWNANRGAITLRITVKGRPAHVGLQHRGINAFELMLEVARALQKLKSEVEARTTGWRIVPEEAAHSILMLGGRVEGGTNFNVVPGTCSFTLERRFNPEEDLETEKARLFAELGKLRKRGIDVDTEVLQECHSSGVPEDGPVARALVECIDAVTGSRPEFTMCPGALEIRWYARRGIPAFAYGPDLLDVSHGPHEAVDLESVYRNVLVYALAAARLLS